MDDDLKIEVLAHVIAIGIIIAILVVIYIACHIHDVNKWNDGYCSCGGKWVYQQAVGHRVSTGFLYECDNCGKISEFDEKR